jgi:hypothetical protein
VVDNAVLLVKDGRIEAVGSARETAVPEGYEVLDLGARWLMPGMIDLHSHQGGTGDINDMVYLINPELRVSTAVIPANRDLERGLAAGVTAVLFIPGSGTNAGGQGVLIKTGFEGYERSEIRNPGSLKVAQWGNPERWAIGVGKTVENYNLREMFTRGLAYAKRWQRYEQEGGERPARDIQWELFRDLLAKKVQVSVHTQVYQVVLMTITMIRGEFGLDVFLDHSSLDGWRTGALAHEMGVPAIVGPRSVDWPDERIINWVGVAPERAQGIAAGYQAAGHDMVGFNTDASVIPQEELFLQSCLAVRYGFDSTQLQNVRGLTIVPARAAGIDDRLGSLEPGKDADVLVISGDPSDPRTSVESVFLEGQRVYDAAADGRRF